MGRLTEWLVGTVRRLRDRLAVTDGAGGAPEEPADTDPPSETVLLDRVTESSEKTDNLIRIRDEESKRRIAEDAAYSKTSIERLRWLTGCVIAVFLALGFLCLVVRGIHVAVPKTLLVPLSVAVPTVVTAIAYALGRFLRGRRGGGGDAR